MAQLHLRLSPGQRLHPLEGHCITMSIGQIEYVFACRGGQRPESNPRRCTARDSHMSTQAEDRIEHGACCIGEWPAIGNSRRRMNGLSAPKKARTIGLKLCGFCMFTLHHGEMRCPDERVTSRATATSREDRAELRDKFRLYEKRGKGGMCFIIRLSREDDFGIRRDFNV